MVDSNYILAPPIVKVRFDIAPAFNGLDSIRTITETQRLSGFSEWVTQMAAALSKERTDLNILVFDAFMPLFYDVMPAMIGYESYSEYVDAVAAADPYQLRDAMLREAAESKKYHPEMWEGVEGEVTAEKLLNDAAFFRKYMTMVCEMTGHADTFIDRAYELYRDPPQMQAVIVEHLRWMWDNVFADEWARNEPMLRESVAAFETMDFSNLTLIEAARAVTTRDLSVNYEDKFNDVEEVVFIPSAHIGPYVLSIKRETTAYLVFGARLPRGMPNPASALNRAELLTRLSALADDTRLRILELLTKHEELCAQDIIEQLGMSQSSASRHLSQLNATGFIVVRRRDVAKCYSLNPERVVDTLRTLTSFLSQQ